MMREKRDYSQLCAVFEATAGRCWYCGKQLTLYGETPEEHDRLTPFIEHQLPVVRGGTNDPQNLVLTCRSCNTTKGTKTMTEYRQWLERTKRTPVVFYGESRR